MRMLLSKGTYHNCRLQPFPKALDSLLTSFMFLPYSLLLNHEISPLGLDLSYLRFSVVSPHLKAKWRERGHPHLKTLSLPIKPSMKQWFVKTAAFSLGFCLVAFLFWVRKRTKLRRHFGIEMVRHW